MIYISGKVITKFTIDSKSWEFWTSNVWGNAWIDTTEKKSWDLFQLFLVILRAKLLSTVPLCQAFPHTLEVQNSQDLESIVNFVITLPDM